MSKEDAVMSLVSKGLKELFSTRDREQIDFQHPLLPREKITRFSFVARCAKFILELFTRYRETNYSEVYYSFSINEI